MTVRSFTPLIVSLIVFLAVCAMYAFGYYTLENDAIKATKLAIQINTKQQQLDRLTRSRAALSTLSSDEATLQQYSIGKDEVVPFLETLQATGKPLGATVDVLSVGDEKSGTHSRIVLSLTITGSFDGVMRTLGAIEYSPYDSVIRTLSLDTASGGSIPVWTAATIYSVGLRSASSTPVAATSSPIHP